MFARISSTLLAFTLVVAIAAAPSRQCSGEKSLKCCNNTQDAKSLDADWVAFFNYHEVDVKQLTGLIGFACSDIDVIGSGGGSSCNHQTVCCPKESFNGVAAIGCTPIEGFL